MTTSQHYTAIIASSIIILAVILLSGCSATQPPSDQATGPSLPPGDQVAAQPSDQATKPPAMSTHLLQPDPASPWALTYGLDLEATQTYNLIIMRRAIQQVQANLEAMTPRDPVTQPPSITPTPPPSDSATEQPNDTVTEQQTNKETESQRNQKSGTPGE